MAWFGGGAELAVAVPAAALAGERGLVAALCGGALAAGAQLAAVALLRPGMRAGTPEFVRRWAAGIAVRAVSAAALVALVLATRTLLPPLWTVLGFFAVLLTLLYAETRFLA
jgi:hypothetical protein